MCFRDWRRTFSNLFICMLVINNIYIYIYILSDFPEEWSGVIAYDKFGP